MSLFSSPAVRVFNENSESQIQRKPGTNTLLPRKPFVDKTVNCNTPDVNRKQKSSLTIKESVKTPSPTIKTPNLEMEPEWFCSYKEVDNNYEDLFAYHKPLEYHHVYNILKAYHHQASPPPFETFEPPPVNSLESSFSSDKSYDEDLFFARNARPRKTDVFLEPDDEIDLPVFNIDI